MGYLLATIETSHRFVRMTTIPQMPSAVVVLKNNRRTSMPRPFRCRAARPVIAVCVAILWTIPSVGCRKATGPERFDVEGTVTFDGQPVPTGLLVLEPDASKGNGGPVSVLEISNGRFDSRQPGAKGPLQGPLIARITGYPEADPSVEIPKPLFREYQTTVDLAPDGNVSVLDFHIEKQSTPRR